MPQVADSFLSILLHRGWQGIVQEADDAARLRQIFLELEAALDAEDEQSYTDALNALETHATSWPEA